jgi:hypothetical protein
MVEVEVEEMIMIAMMTVPAAARTIAEVRETATTIAMTIDAHHRRAADVMTTMMMRSRDTEDAAAVARPADGAEDEVTMAAA